MLDGQELLDYAYEKFENEAYDAALDAFVLAYTKEYEQEWILENVYNCYMAGNEAEFQKNYCLWNTGEKPAYENLTLDFVPYREGEYYIFDKETQKFRGVFPINSIQSVLRQEEFQQTEFSALAVAMDWDWNSLPDILAEAEFRKIYVVCQDMNRCASFFKLPELMEFAKNIMLFSDIEAFQHHFHEHTSEYLPKLCVGTEEGKKRLLDIMNQEHEYRLTPEGRNTDNVLLTIGIPIHDRGNLLLKRLENLMQMPYDAEVEFAVSKNGMTLFQEEYRQASEISDARINYEGCDKELGMSGNWQNVVKISHGKFVMFVSDEDAVICIKEGASVMQQEREQYREAGNAQRVADYETENSELGVVSTYDARISQFRGGVELLQGFDKINDDIRLRALSCLGNKTVYLMTLVYEACHYQVDEFPVKVQELLDEILMVMERWGVDWETKKAILKSMQRFMPKQMLGTEIFQGAEYEMDARTNRE